MHPARRWLAFLSAAIAALLAVVLPPAVASAAMQPAAGTRVGASHPATTVTVGASRPVPAGQRQCDPALQPAIVSGACVAPEEVGVDANPLIRGLDHGEMDKLNAALAGRAPVVSPQAASEYLAGGDAGSLADFLSSNGGRIGSQVTNEEAAALRSQANSLTDQFGNSRALGVGDSYVVGSAMRDNVPLITQDRQIIGFLRAIDYPVEPF